MWEALWAQVANRKTNKTDLSSYETSKNGNTFCSDFLVWMVFESKLYRLTHAQFHKSISIPPYYWAGFVWC